MICTRKLFPHLHAEYLVSESKQARLTMRGEGNQYIMARGCQHRYNKVHGRIAQLGFSNDSPHSGRRERLFPRSKPFFFQHSIYVELKQRGDASAPLGLRGHGHGRVQPPLSPGRSHSGRSFTKLALFRACGAKRRKD